VGTPCARTRGGWGYPHRIRCSQDSGDTRCPPRPRIPYPPCPTTPTCVFRRGSRLPAVFLISHTRLFEAKPRPRVYFGIPIRFTDDVTDERGAHLRLDDAVSAACVRRSPLRQQLGRHNTRRVAARRPRRALRHRRCRALHMVQARWCTARRAAAAAAAATAAAMAAMAATVAAATVAAATTRQPRTCGIAARRDSHAARRARRS
jgi:hypothetical protein